MASANNQKQPTGVGGWLLFMSFCFCFISPFTGFDALAEVPEYGELLGYAWVALSVGTGILLWAGNYYGLVLSKLIFSANMLLAAYYCIALGNGRVPSVYATSEVFGKVLASAIGSSIWLLYLCYSKRVANTYYTEESCNATAQEEEGLGESTPLEDEDFDAAIRKLAKLHSEGIITDEEFAAKKKQVLNL